MEQNKKVIKLGYGFTVETEIFIEDNKRFFFVSLKKDGVETVFDEKCIGRIKD